MDILRCQHEVLSPGFLNNVIFLASTPHLSNLLAYHEANRSNLGLVNIRLINSLQLQVDSIISTFSSVQFSRSVLSDSLRPHELKHARPPCPSPSLGFTQTHVHRVSEAIQPFHPLSSPSPPAPNPSSIRVFSNESALHIRYQRIGVSALASVLPMNIQD